MAGTRYVEGGSAGSFSEQARRHLARWRPRLTHRLVGTPSQRSDERLFHDAARPVRRTSRRSLSPVGFKILLDIAATGGRAPRASPNSPMSSATRFDGESKFNAQIGVEFLGLLLAKMTGDLVDPRFIFFAIVGTLGLVVHLVVLRLALAVPAATPFRARPDHRHLRGHDQQFPAQQ